MIPRNETQQSPAQETDFVLALAQGSPLPAPITALQYAQNQSSQSTAPAPYIQQENGVGTLTPISPFEMKTQESLFQVRNMSLEQRYLRSDTILPYWRQDYQQDRLASVPFSQQLSSLFDNRCGAEEVTQLHRLEAFSPSLLPISGDGNGCQDITAFEFAETNHPVAEQERVIEGVERTQLNPSDSNSSFSL
ncbi:hypothetical protein MMC20_002146 [Loxospora ochrophaea]|nr:hypothetical protein [Loxospora ochrophaea]